MPTEAPENGSKPFGIMQEKLDLSKKICPQTKRQLTICDEYGARYFTQAKVKTIALTEYVQLEKLLDRWKASQKQSDLKTRASSSQVSFTPRGLFPAT